MCDFAQHVIIDPTGIIWLGRNWNLPPGSAVGHNGDRKIGPFAVVVLGDFGVGGDRFLGEQRITTIHTIGLVQKRFDLDLETLRLHREMSTTECPGSTLHRLHILEAVREFRNSSTFVGSTSHAAAGDGPFRAECDTLCQVLEDFSNHMPLEIEPADAEIIHQENADSTRVSSSDHGPNASSSSFVPLISETVSLLGKCDHEAEAGHSSSQVLGYPRATEGVSFTLGQGVLSATSHNLPYERDSGDPLYRPLRIFVLDPSVSLMDGSVEVVGVPYEPLSPGPAGSLFVVDDYDESQQRKYIEVDLDEPRNLMRNGREPSVTDPLFHQQMVYAVCSTVYPAFRFALGRHVGWGFQRSGDYVTRLQIRPHAFERKTSYYDETRGELSFGYYRRMTDVAGRTLPSGWIFSCLSFEIVAHDVTHALLHGLRSCFIIPSSPDVPAFHEAFADIVALFSHFSLSGAVDAAIRRSHGRFSVASVMENVAREFSYFSWTAESLRTTLTPDSTNRALFTDTPRYGLVSNKKSDPYELGSILISAVFEAFLTVLSRKVKLYVELATGGSGELLIERLPSGLISLLAKKASKARLAVFVYVHPWNRLLPSCGHSVWRFFAGCNYRGFRSRP